MKTRPITLLLLVQTLAGRAQAALATVKLPYGATLTMRRIPYPCTGQRLAYSSISGLAIGRRPVYGTDGEPPRYELASASLLLQGVRYQLPVSRMYNPWFGRKPLPRLFRLAKLPQGYQLRAMLSDGASSYTVKWLLSKGIAERTVLSNDERYAF